MDRSRGPATGLNRTGKSCRLRWVNYLHPGLKRGRLSPHEQRLVLQLHSQYGNRWSRIARKLPGRTDNEIKNYWRTHMRKKAQERKRNNTWSSSSSPSQSSTSLSYVSPSSPTDPLLDQTGGCCSSQGLGEEGLGYSMDQIWNEIAKPAQAAVDSELSSFEGCRDEACRIACPPPMPSPLWEYSSESLMWKLDEEELKMFPSMGGFEFEVSNYHHGRESLASN